ncbi:MAG: ankyrin repeat domain-containing protein [Candidatus Moranbacteria bacterium]|nr:ankyrin repeat domain-containing protein [Candidatus Moranbacteria bacterium]
MSTTVYNLKSRYYICKVRFCHLKEEIQRRVELGIIWIALVLINKLGFDKNEILWVICGFTKSYMLRRKSKEKILGLAKSLLDRGAHVDGLSLIWNDWTEATPLMKVVFFYEGWFGDAMVKLLIDYGADLNAEDFSGLTPMAYAARKADIKKIKELWVSGANVLDDPDSYPVGSPPTSKALYYVGYNTTRGRGGRRVTRRAKELLQKLAILECRERGIY